MKKTILSVLLMIVTLTAMAIPALPGKIPVTQPDGSSLTIELYGDEFFSYATTEDGYLLVNNKNGEWQYAQWMNNRAVSLNLKANDAALRSVKEIETLDGIGKFHIAPETLSSLRVAGTQKMQKAPSVITKIAPNEVARGLVILVNFANKRFKSETANADFDSLLNQDGYSVSGSIGSANNYFQDMSYGTYDPHFDVFGPVTLDHDMAYYGARNGSSNDARPAQMVVDAMAKLMGSADSANIDLNNYDGDNDEKIDNVFIFFAGNPESQGASSNTIWPHKWTVYKGNVEESSVRFYQGKQIYNYACASELRGNNSGYPMSGIGTFCHEFTHVLGLPDIYDTKYSGHKTSGQWDIMNSGGHNGDGYVPPEYTAYERFFMNWVKPTLLSEAGMYTLGEISTSDSASYIISPIGLHNMNGADPDPKEFYILESRVKEGWDRYIPGNGMIITKINYNEETWFQNTVNDDPNAMGVDIIEADGDDQTVHSGKPGDAFPGPALVDSFVPYAQYPIKDIRSNNGTISFVFIGATYTVTFNTEDYGTCDIESLEEDSAFSGIRLPEVTADSAYEFIGWSTYRSAHIDNAGKAGDMFYTTHDIDLYAVYTLDGDTVLSNGGCLTESFNRLTVDGSTNIRDTIDYFADNAGWNGDKLYCDNSAIRINGTITTPEVGIEGNANIFIKMKGDNRGKLNIEVLGEGELNKTELSIYPFYENIRLFISHCSYTTRLKLGTTVDEMYIDSMEVCLTDEVSTPTITEDHNITVINNEIITGLEYNDIVRCIDISGKILWTKVADENHMYFTAPDGLYLVSIIRNGNIITLKSINNK